MKRADQILADIQFGDAVTDHAFALQKALRNLGYQSEIFAEHIHPALAGRARPISAFHPGELVIHHFAIGSGLNERIKEIKDCKKVLIYHNITPPHFFEGYNLHSQTLCVQALQQLETLKDCYHLCIGVSEYNCEQLRNMGFLNVCALPILYDFQHLPQEGDPAMMKALDTGTANILFLGRIAPNKKQEDVIKAFYLFQRIRPDSRLLLAGGYQGMEKYLNELISLSSLLGIADKVSFLGKVSYETMTALYKRADLLLSMSEHEGFCVPLLEAMYFDLPVLAYVSSAIPETLGGGGVLFYEKNYPLVAEMMERMVTDQALRQDIISAQRERLKELDEAVICKKFEAIIKDLKL